MKKTFIVIAMLLLVFAISCDGDNPAPGDTPSTSVPEIPDSAPDTFTEVPEDQRDVFVSTALRLFPAVFQEEAISKLLGPDSSDSINEETVSGTRTISGDSFTVSLKFDGFTLTTLAAQEQGMDVTLWGEFSLTGKLPGDSGISESMKIDSYTFNLVMTLSGQNVPSGNYHMEGTISSTNTSTIYLNDDPVSVTIQPPTSNQ